jgi:hypothetical protein
MFVILTRIKPGDRWTAYAYTFDTEGQATAHMFALSNTGVYLELTVRKLM